MSGNLTGPSGSVLTFFYYGLVYVLGLLTAAIIPRIMDWIWTRMPKPNLILDELTVRRGDANQQEYPNYLYCSITVRNEPPKGHFKLVTRKGRVLAQGCELWLTALRLPERRQTDPYALLWPLDDNPKKYDIPNNGRPYRVMIMHIDPQSKRIMIPTGPPLGQGRYNFSTLPAGRYDLTLEIGPPTERTLKVWHNLGLPDDIVKMATN